MQAARDDDDDGDDDDDDDDDDGGRCSGSKKVHNTTKTAFLRDLGRGQSACKKVRSFPFSILQFLLLLLLQKED